MDRRTATMIAAGLLLISLLRAWLPESGERLGRWLLGEHTELAEVMGRGGGSVRG